MLLQLPKPQPFKSVVNPDGTFAPEPNLATKEGDIEFPLIGGPLGQTPSDLDVAIQLTREQDRKNVDAARAGQQAGIDTLTNTSADILERAKSNDPDRDFISDLLEKRINEPLFSDQQRASYDLEIAQSIARARNQMNADAAGRGVLDSGQALVGGASLDIQGDVAGLQLDASLDEADREAQDRAITSFASFQQQMERTDLAVDSIVANLDTNIANLQADVPLANTDFIAFHSLEMAEEMWADERAFRDEMLTEFEESQELDWLDWLKFGIEAVTAGGPGDTLLKWIAG